MKILVINCGSSSLKYQLINMESESVLVKGPYERTGIEDSRLTREARGKDKHVVESPVPNRSTAIRVVMDMLVDPVCGAIKDTSEISTMGRRMLHARTAYSGSIVVNDDVKRAIRECFDLGPLHNPVNLMSIEACEEITPGTPNMVVFDAAFGMSMPGKVYLYAIPHEYFEKYSIRRYGSHGTGYKFVSGEAIKFGNLDPEKAKVVVCHLSNGASIFAFIGGKCVDTSMGLTPLEDLITGARSGDVDPTVVQFICNKEGKAVNEVLDILNRKSGAPGMNGGTPSDFRDVGNTKAEGNHLTAVIFDVFQHRVIKYIGAHAAAVNGVGTIVFTIGVGENDKPGRKAIYEFLGYLGVKTDDETNNMRSRKRITPAPDSKTKVILILTNEELATARETLALAR